MDKVQKYASTNKCGSPLAINMKNLHFVHHIIIHSIHRIKGMSIKHATCSRIQQLSISCIKMASRMLKV
jgi:hypothetical protein